MRVKEPARNTAAGRAETVVSMRGKISQGGKVSARLVDPHGRQGKSSRTTLRTSTIGSRHRPSPSTFQELMLKTASVVFGFEIRLFAIASGIEADSAMGCTDEQDGACQAPVSRAGMFA